ncbi:hypothetical protein Plhal304r1_c088g0170311 [Plasmopara halstedii]
MDVFHFEKAHSMATRNRKRFNTQRQKAGADWAKNKNENCCAYVDPNLMTERQQLAFLLRTTAHDACNGLSVSGDESSSGEVEKSLRLNKKHGWTQGLDEEKNVTSALYQPSRRLPKMRKKARVCDKPKLRIQKDISNEKTPKYSPSASDDIMHLDVVHFGQQSLFCALCCDYDALNKSSFSDVLFLCPACDQKYPTQQTLGRCPCVTSSF